MTAYTAKVVHLESETDPGGGSLWTIKVAKMPAGFRAGEAEPDVNDVPEVVQAALLEWLEPDA